MMLSKLRYSNGRSCPSGGTGGLLARHLVGTVALALGLVPTAGAALVLMTPADAGAVSAPCEPHIAHISPFLPGKAPDVTITGTCFGAGHPFHGNSDDFRVTDLGAHGSLSQLENAGKVQQTWWNACAGTTDAINGGAPNVVTCNVSAWSNTSITFNSFGSAYGEYREGPGNEELNWVVATGDKVVVQVWDASMPLSASWCQVTVAAPGAAGSGTTCSSVLVAGNPVISGGSTQLHPGTDKFGPGNKLLPATLGGGECQYQEFVDHSFQAQIAVSQANCTQADAVGVGAFQARGAAYKADGFACTGAAAGAGSAWASAWTGTYYVYNCQAGAAQVAFNWGPHYSYAGGGSGGSGGGSGGSSGGSPVIAGGGGGSPYPGTDQFGPGNTLLPAPLGQGQCEYQEFRDESYQAQIAVYKADCTQADAVGIGAYKARGSGYSADGFTCKATPEGSGSEWASAWTGTYYAYDCKSATAQVAFNWGTQYA